MEGDLERLVRRVRQLPPAAWPARREAVRQLLAELAALGDAMEPHDVPQLPDYALADALAVIGGDAVEAAQRSTDPRHGAAASEALRRGLSAIS